MENIEAQFPSSLVDDNTVLVTAPDIEWAEKRAVDILNSALENYTLDRQSYVIPADSTTSQTVTLDWIDEVASGLNSNRDNIITVNAVLLQKILSDGYFGRTYESVVSNVNTAFSLSYGENELDESCQDELAQVKTEIDYFNSCVNMPQLIRDVVGRVFTEGNCEMTLRYAKGKAPSIDMYPISLCYCSDYMSGGLNIMEFAVTDLRQRLQKTYRKNRRNKPVYFKDLDDEIKNNYPKEVYDAYRNGDTYVRMDPRYSFCVKINDFGRKFGVSPLFRALKPLLVLEQIEKADVSDSKARSKKIVVQILRKEALGPDGTRKGLDLASYAHKQLATALSTNNAVYTAPPFVESISYITPKAANEDVVNQQKQYTEKLLIALGIGFTDINSTVGAGQISVKQLLRTVNAICESFAVVMNRIYITFLEDNGHEAKFAPKLKVIESEQMEADMRRDLAQFVYGTLNGSLTSALEIIGVDPSEEFQKRKKENEDGFDDVFYPRMTSYTNSYSRRGYGYYGRQGNYYNYGPGRPADEDSNNEEKQQYDQQYTENVRE